MKIWIVTTGEYSDYQIRGVFTQEALALRFQELCNGQTAEWESDTPVDAPAGMLPWRVDIEKDGSAVAERADAETAQFEIAQPYCGIHDEEEMVFHLWARDEVHAIKIANERRLKLIALGQWGTTVNLEGK